VTPTGKRVLIVEDDKFLRRACQARLEQQGYTILTAQDGEEALRIVRTDIPDLILLDLLMPKMNGLEVLRILRAEESTRTVPVLVLSNSSRQEDVATIRELGISGYFVKANLSLQDLSTQVKTLLDAR
jgi:two-component system, OmpR family, alkaline phosphatase synthesis response regulator PhoP